MPAARKSTHRQRTSGLAGWTALALATIVCGAASFYGVNIYLERTGGPVTRITEFEAFKKKSEGLKLLGRGWAVPEDWGVWSVGPLAEMTWRLRERPDQDIRVNIEAWIYPNIAKVEQQIRVKVNGTQVAVLERNWEEGILGGVFKVPPAVASARNPMQIVFEISRPTSPQDIGEGTDTRKLGLGLKSIEMHY